MMKIVIDMDALDVERVKLYEARANWFCQAKERAEAMKGHPGAHTPDVAASNRKDFLFLASQKIESEDNADKITAKISKIEEFQDWIKDAIETGAVGVYIEDGQIVEKATAEGA